MRAKKSGVLNDREEYIRVNTHINSSIHIPSSTHDYFKIYLRAFHIRIRDKKYGKSGEQIISLTKILIES